MEFLPFVCFTPFSETTVILMFFCYCLASPADHGELPGSIEHHPRRCEAPVVQTTGTGDTAFSAQGDHTWLTSLQRGTSQPSAQSIPQAGFDLPQ